MAGRKKEIEMKKIILFVEDMEEMVAPAKDFITAAGFGFITADNLQDAERLFGKVKVAGVITDMFFPQRPKATDTTPCGVTVITMALAAKVPVVVCSSAGHEADYVKAALKHLELITGTAIPMPGNKDLKACITAIKQLTEEAKI
jgi:hypothetical protein